MMHQMKNSGCQADNFTYASIFDGIGRSIDIPKLEQYLLILFTSLLFASVCYISFPFYLIISSSFILMTKNIYDLSIQFYRMMTKDGVACDIVIFNTLINVSKTMT